MTTTNLPTLLLAREHLDPTRGEIVAKIRKPTKSTSYSVPAQHDAALLMGDGGVRAVYLEQQIHETEKHTFYSFTPLRDGEETVQISEFLALYDLEDEEDDDAPSLFAGEKGDDQ